MNSLCSLKGSPCVHESLPLYVFIQNMCPSIPQSGNTTIGWKYIMLVPLKLPWSQNLIEKYHSDTPLFKHGISCCHNQDSLGYRTHKKIPSWSQAAWYLGCISVVHTSQKSNPTSTHGHHLGSLDQNHNFCEALELTSDYRNEKC